MRERNYFSSDYRFELWKRVRNLTPDHYLTSSILLLGLHFHPLVFFRRSSENTEKTIPSPAYITPNLIP